MKATPLFRAIAIAALHAASMACAHRTPAPPPALAGTAAAPAAPAALFVAIPEVQAAAVRNPHQHEGRPLCQRCHVVAGGLRGDPVALCTGCHPQRHRNHPVGVVQKTAVSDLPLLPGSKMACHTCHDPHDTKKQESGLRFEYEALCLRCHRRHH